MSAIQKKKIPPKQSSRSMLVTFDKRLLLSIVRRWLYIVSIVSYLATLLPIAIVAYKTFYDTLVPNPIIQVPIEFKQQQSLIDLSSINLDQPNLDYNVVLNIQIYCNRNRNDDLYPIEIDFQFGDVSKQKQMILNCDLRSIYNENNWLIPYNLRFWIPPVLTNINKYTTIKQEILKLSSNQLILNHNDVSLSLSKELIINNDATFLEFHVVYKGFRYYITKYYMISSFVGISIFWLISASFGGLLSLVLFYYKISNQKIKTE